MLRAIDTNMVELYKSMVDTILKAIEVLLVKTNYIKDFVSTFKNDHDVETLQTTKYCLTRIYI